VVIAFLCVFGAASRLLRSLDKNAGSLHDLWVDLLGSVASPPLPWFDLVIACITPLQYILFPPDVPEREESLERDPSTGIAYPKAKAKQATWTMKEIRYVQLHSLTILYAGCVFIGTYWI
jgi:hypothetical protein